LKKCEECGSVLLHLGRGEYICNDNGDCSMHKKTQFFGFSEDKED